MQKVIVIINFDINNDKKNLHNWQKLFKNVHLFVIYTKKFLE